MGDVGCTGRTLRRNQGRRGAVSSGLRCNAHWSLASHRHPSSGAGEASTGTRGHTQVHTSAHTSAQAHFNRAEPCSRAAHSVVLLQYCIGGGVECHARARHPEKKRVLQRVQHGTDKGRLPQPNDRGLDLRLTGTAKRTLHGSLQPGQTAYASPAPIRNAATESVQPLAPLQLVWHS